MPASHQFDARHGRVVTGTRTELQDAQVVAGAVAVARPDLGEQLVRDVLVVDGRDHLTPLVHAAGLGLGDEVLGVGAQGLRLRPRGDEVAGLEQARRHVRHDEALMGGVTPDPRTLLGGRHGYSLVRRARPRSSSFWSTSSSDFEPKFVIARRSSSVFWTSWPMVSTRARF